MTKEIRTQWHPAFCSAIKLEFKEDKQYLEYYEEYNLNTKPLQIDLLVIKKAVEIELKNEIGKIFRGHNIIEYKSPEDALDVNTFLKTIAYACLYKTKEHYMDAIHLDDITLTFIRKGYPRKLIKWFRKNGYIVTKEFEGVFL